MSTPFLPYAAVLFLSALHEPIPPDISSGLELARYRRAATEGKISHLQGSMANFKGDPSPTPAMYRYVSLPKIQLHSAKTPIEMRFIRIGTPVGYGRGRE